MRFSGEIGFAQSVEGTGNHIGIWEDVITERHYYGDVLQNYHRWEQGIDINENLNLSNKISIFADRFCLDNYFKMRYVVLNGCRWKITNIEIQRPRMILTIGGVWNGPKG